MIPTIPNISYRQLAEALREVGFTVRVTEKGREFRHPSGAVLPLPQVGDDDPVRVYHMAAALAAVDDYGIVTREAFDRMFSRTPDRSFSITPA